MGGSVTGTLALGASRGAGGPGAAEIDEDRSARDLICSDQLKPSPEQTRSQSTLLSPVSIHPYNTNEAPLFRTEGGLSEVDGENTIVVPIS